jgi:signal transduction histidine kinase
MNQANDIRYLVIVGIAVMLLLFASVLMALFFNQRKKIKHQQDLQLLREQQQNQLIEAAVRSEETERHRIAETLHDEVGAILSSAKLHLLGIKEEKLDEKDKKLHEKGGELLNEVIRKVRSISHTLHSNILKEFGLNEAVNHFVSKITGGSRISSEVTLDEKYQCIDAERDISLYRMIQEIINNILKYADATEVNVSSTFRDNVLQFVIFHNGKGLTQEEFEKLRYQKEGLGLKNIQNRIILLKGGINFLKNSAGYMVIIDVPVKPNES